MGKRTRRTVRRVKKAVALSLISFLLSGCSVALKQRSRTVGVVPVSSGNHLNEGLEGHVCVLRATTNTGQEQFDRIVSASFVEALTNYVEKHGLNLKVSSYLDLVSYFNSVKNWEAVRKFAELDKHYQRHHFHEGSGLGFFSGLKDVEISHFFQPYLMGAGYLSSSRASIFGLRAIKTQNANAMIGYELWQAESGEMVFGAYATSDVARDTITEGRVSLDEPLERAWEITLDRLLTTK